MNLQEHLDFYGIKLFDSDFAWEQYCNSKLSKQMIKAMENKRKPMASSDHLNKRPFYDFAGSSLISGIVHSERAETIIAEGEAVATKIHGPNVLDIGCHTGYLTTYYAKQYPNVSFTGIDVSAPAIRTAKDYAGKLKISNVSFAELDFLESRAKGQFDTVVDTSVIYDFGDEKHKAFSHIYELLSTSGNYLTTVPAGQLLEFGYNIFEKKLILNNNLFFAYLKDIERTGLIFQSSKIIGTKKDNAHVMLSFSKTGSRAEVNLYDIYKEYINSFYPEYIRFFN